MGIFRIQKKEKWEEIEKFIRTKNIKYLYHFTDFANLKSIREHGGLCSWYYCECNKIVIPKPGGNELSRDLDLNNRAENFVRLSFIEDPPMLHVMKRDGRIDKEIFIKVDIEVLFWEYTLYANRNATEKGDKLNIGGKLEDLKQIQFHLFKKKYFNLSYEEKKYYQAEILVYEKIPIKYLKKFYYYK